MFVSFFFSSFFKKQGVEPGVSCMLDKCLALLEEPPKGTVKDILWALQLVRGRRGIGVTGAEVGERDVQGLSFLNCPTSPRLEYFFSAQPKQGYVQAVM